MSTPESERPGGDALDQTFDELIESLVGFYRSWFLSLGVELGAAGKLIQRYTERIFSRHAFAQSLTPAERALR